jgi:excisionase family DNA binding protein
MQQELQKRGFRPPEAAIYLGVSVRTLYSYIHDGKLKATKPSNRVTVITKESLDSLLEGKK